MKKLISNVKKIELDLPVRIPEQILDSMEVENIKTIDDAIRNKIRESTNIKVGNNIIQSIKEQYMRSLLEFSYKKVAKDSPLLEKVFTEEKELGRKIKVLLNKVDFDIKAIIAKEVGGDKDEAILTLYLSKVFAGIPFTWVPFNVNKITQNSDEFTFNKYSEYIYEREKELWNQKVYTVSVKGPRGGVSVAGKFFTEVEYDNELELELCKGYSLVVNTIS